MQLLSIIASILKGMHHKILILDGFGPGFVFRLAGVLALLIFILVTLIGTVPINMAALTWQPRCATKQLEGVSQPLGTIRCRSFLGCTLGLHVLLDSRGATAGRELMFEGTPLNP